MASGGFESNLEWLREAWGQNERGEWPADNFLIRGTRFNQGVLLQHMIDQGADIINLSIGLFGPCPASMQAAINDAVAAGAIVVSAAGNARVDTQYFAPGGCQNVISVAANDARGQLTPYSNFGANVSIMAPGGDMARDDDADGRPDGILSTKFMKNCSDPANYHRLAEMVERAVRR